MATAIRNSYVARGEKTVVHLRTAIHALEPFQNEPGKRRFVQIVFVLLCAAVGVGVAAGMAWLMGNWTSHHGVRSATP